MRKGKLNEKLQYYFKSNGLKNLKQQILNPYKNFQRKNNGLKKTVCKRVNHNTGVSETLINKEIIYSSKHIPQITTTSANVSEISSYSLLWYLLFACWKFITFLKLSCLRFLFCHLGYLCCSPLCPALDLQFFFCCYCLVCSNFGYIFGTVYYFFTVLYYYFSQV